MREVLPGGRNRQVNKGAYRRAHLRQPAGTGLEVPQNTSGSYKISTCPSAWSEASFSPGEPLLKATILIVCIRGVKDLALRAFPLLDLFPNPKWSYWAE